MENSITNKLSAYILADGFDITLDLKKSKGAYIYDKRTGRKYVDFFSCFASMPLGFNHDGLANDEFKEKIFRAAINKPSISDLYPEQYFTFIETFFRLAVPKTFKHSFFIDGGALANENALKVAFDWKTRKVLNRTGSIPKDLKVIYFNEAFHGRSGYTLTITNTDPVKTLYFPKFDWIKINNPKLSFPLTNEIIEEVKKQEQDALNQVRKSIELYPDEVAAIIIEPIQSEGGDNHFRKEFLEELRKISQENELLLIFDEVQTGVGMTGTFWYHEQINVTPDILTFGKKMQICGLIATDRVDDIPDNVFKVSSRINSTWGGNLVDMVRSQRYLEVIFENNYMENVKTSGTYISNKISDLCSRYEVLSNPRGVGLLCAMDIRQDLQKKFIAKAYENGMFILKCGNQSIRFRTNLTISSDEIDEGFEIIEKTLKDIL